MSAELTPVALPTSLVNMARQMAEREGRSLDSLLDLALRRGLREQYWADFEERVKHADPERAREILRNAGTDEVIPGDELPPGWHDKQ